MAVDPATRRAGLSLGLRESAAQLAAQGRGGDTELVHVTPRELAWLHERGGSGTRNPKTGLLEFFEGGEGASTGGGSGGGLGGDAGASMGGGGNGGTGNDIGGGASGNGSGVSGLSAGPVSGMPGSMLNGAFSFDTMNLGFNPTTGGPGLGNVAGSIGKGVQTGVSDGGLNAPGWFDSMVGSLVTGPAFTAIGAPPGVGTVVGLAAKELGYDYNSAIGHAITSAGDPSMGMKDAGGILGKDANPDAVNGGSAQSLQHLLGA